MYYYDYHHAYILWILRIGDVWLIDWLIDELILQTPTLLGSVPNGWLYEAPAQEYNRLYLLHVYGTPYEMG